MVGTGGGALGDMGGVWDLSIWVLGGLLGGPIDTLSINFIVGEYFNWVWGGGGVGGLFVFLGFCIN